jgi:hypothetical protein
MSEAELRDLIQKANEELELRDVKRFNELVVNVVSAVQALLKEFPGATCMGELYLEGEYIDFNALEYIDFDFFSKV